MTCRTNLNDSLNRLAAAVGVRNPFPDAARASTPAGRTLASGFVMNVITSDAPLHHVRKNLAAAGIAVTENTNFADAFGNVGNAVGDSQIKESNEYITPMVKALSAIADKYGIAGEAARKQLGLDIGQLREAYHALERQSVFRNIKGSFKGYDAPPNTDTYAKAVEASKKRKKLNKQFDKGQITPEEYRAQLDAIIAEHPIDDSTTDQLGGMFLDQARQAIADLEAKPNVKDGYAQLKPYIDRVFRRVNTLYHEGGKLNDTSARYRELYGFDHYAPVYSVDMAENLNEADFMQNISPGALQVAEGGVPHSRVPFFAAVNIDLNAAAKFTAENKAAWKLGNFTREHGKETGFHLSGGVEVYSIGEAGHQVAHQSIPVNSVPMFHEGKMYWVTIRPEGNAANAQLFQAIKNRMTNNFMSGTSPVSRAISTVVTHAPARLFTNLNVQFWLNSFVRDPLGVLTNVWLDSRIPNKAKVTARMAALMAGPFNHIKAQQYFHTRPEERVGAQLRDLQDASLLSGVNLSGVQSEFADWMSDLAAHGGETAFNRAFHSADYTDVNVGDSLRAAVPWNLGGNISNAADAGVQAVEAGHRVLAFGGNLVTAFDMQARVSVYRALVEGGMKKTEAAAVVREFMDFSQKSLKPHELTTLIPFFRTATVGAYRAWDSVFYNEKGEFAPKWGPLATMAVLGYMLALASKGEDDEDGMATGDKVSHGRMFSHVIIGHNEDGTVHSAPLPYGPAAIFVGLGVAVERMKSGVHDRGDVLAAFTTHVAKNMTPIAMMEPAVGEDIADSFSGAITQLNPVLGATANLAYNQDAFGRPIYDEAAKRKGTLDHASAMPGTAEMWSDLALWMYENTGGAVDMHPETFEFHMKQWMPSGVGRYITGEIDRTERRELNSPDDADWLPMWEHVAGSVFLDKSPTMYWHNQFKKSQALMNDINNMEAAGRELTPEMIRFRDEFGLHDQWIRSLNGQQAHMSPEEKLAAKYGIRQNIRAAAVAGLDLQREASFNLLAGSY